MSEATTQQTDARMYSRAKLKQHLGRAIYAFRRYAPEAEERPGPLYLITSEALVDDSMCAVGPCYFFKRDRELRFKPVAIPKQAVTELYERGLVEFYHDAWGAVTEFLAFRE